MSPLFRIMILLFTPFTFTHAVSALEDDIDSEISSDENMEDQPLPDQPEDSCWKIYVHYEPCYYNESKWVDDDQIYKQTYCRTVPQNYNIAKYRVVPEYYTEMFCRLEPEYFEVQECRMKKKRIKERKCKYKITYCEKHAKELGQETGSIESDESCQAEEK
jgi:hypothetical protein